MATWSNVSNARVAVSREVVVSGLLLRLGLGGVALSVWAAVMLVSGETSVATAAAALAVGFAIAVLSLRRAWTLLEQEGEQVTTTQRPAARKASRAGGSVARAAR